MDADHQCLVEPEAKVRAAGGRFVPEGAELEKIHGPGDVPERPRIEACGELLRLVVEPGLHFEVRA